MKRFVNIYKDTYGKEPYTGRLISDKDYDSYNQAWLCRDNFDNYIETVEIITPEPSQGTDNTKAD